MDATFGTIPLKKLPGPSCFTMFLIITNPFWDFPNSAAWILVFITSMGDETRIQAVDEREDVIKCWNNVALSFISKPKILDLKNVDAPKSVNEPGAFLKAVHRQPAYKLNFSFLINEKIFLLLSASGLTWLLIFKISNGKSDISPTQSTILK